ncbi:porin [Burkholderia multivorans]|uniref:porin n=1 Tax=Burkholderia multivorans TaxID=87883 RepID=UPI001C247BB5|nr:porin [Burkholderia multivorans]MCO8353452.1 porin [Burkholderia multivorans]MCO8385711.1 porin [Burkholderia multivorans]MCO8406608.1 porin [Burkholderia multivorans]MCO8434807.1 porin [Burkholderia multivorans]
MKRHLNVLVLAAGTAGISPAFAQSSVTLWGLMDSGISYVSNESGKHNVKMDDGIDEPNIWGLRGREDLGGGTYATFDLVSQFELDSGSFMPGGSLFSRTSTVGLTDRSLGTLKFGNQYDFMTDSLFFGGDDPVELSGHLYAFRAGPFQRLGIPNNPTGDFDWDRMAGEVVNNSVKYVTPTVDGFSAGAMYRFGGVAGSIGEGNGVSYGLNYAQRNFGVNAAYTNLKYAEAGTPSVSIRNWGVGAHYQEDRWTAAALFTTVHNSLNGASVYEGSVGARYQITAALSSGAAYMYMKGNGVLNNNHANQVAANLTYALSKRTQIYLLGLYQRANSGANAQINGLNGPDDASDSNAQGIVRVGLHTQF